MSSRRVIGRTPRFLVVDDEPQIRALCKRVLQRDGYEVEEAANGRAALELLELGEFDVVITDLRMPEMEGLDLLQAVKSRQSDVEVIVVTAHGTIQDAIEAMKHGALDFLEKPFDLQEFSAAAAKALERRSMVREINTLRSELRSRYHMGKMYGKSPAMQELYGLVERFAPTDSTILISGESGTGKEVLARTIHYESSRPNGPFVAVNCGAIVRDIFESELFGHVRGSYTGALSDKAGYFRDASGGTVFLDEITEMPSSAQVKLLRVLQEREVVPVGSTQPIPIDVRVIAASNYDLEMALRDGTLRQDLYFRLNVIRLALPPLRERLEDIPLLAGHFLAQSAARCNRPQLVSFAPDAIELLSAYPWPGNIRELQNAIEYAAALCPGSEILVEHLPMTIRRRAGEPVHGLAKTAPRPLVAEARADSVEPGSFPTLDELEREHIALAMARCAGHRKRAADLLGIDPKTLYRKLLRKSPHTDPDEPGGEAESEVAPTPSPVIDPSAAASANP